MTPWLGGKSVLIVEDEFLIGLMLTKEITGAGGTSLGPVTSVADALKEIESRPVDAVILDAKLVDGSAADLAACLDARRDPLCGGQRLRQGKPAERTETGALRRQAHNGAAVDGSDRRSAGRFRAGLLARRLMAGLTMMLLRRFSNVCAGLSPHAATEELAMAGSTHGSMLPPRAGVGVAAREVQQAAALLGQAAGTGDGRDQGDGVAVGVEGAAARPQRRQPLGRARSIAGINCFDDITGPIALPSAHEAPPRRVHRPVRYPLPRPLPEALVAPFDCAAVLSRPMLLRVDQHDQRQCKSDGL